MNRLYVVENHYTGTGGLADHRYRCKASLIGEFTRQLAGKIADVDRGSRAGLGSRRVSKDGCSL